MTRTLIASLCLAAATLGGCATAPDTTSGKQELAERSSNALARMKREDSSLEGFMKKAYGYAIFPAVGKGGLGVGGAYGRGELYEQGRRIGFCDLTQGTIGLQIGGQEYSELICFEDKSAIERFKSGKLNFAAQASAVALKSGASANAKYRDGVAVFTSNATGLMAEASIGGQQFTYEPE